MSEPIDFFAEPVPVAQDTIAKIIELAERSRELQADVDERARLLAEDQEVLNNLNQKRIPELMTEANMKAFTLADGTTITIEDKVRASISAEHKERAFQWLTDHGFDGIIKTKVQSEFGRGDIEKARQVVIMLREKEIEAVLDQSIHNATLVSFVKERLAEAGDVKESVAKDDGFDNDDTEVAVTLPQDLFGVFEYKNAKFKLPKKKK